MTEGTTSQRVSHLILTKVIEEIILDTIYKPIKNRKNDKK